MIPQENVSMHITNIYTDNELDKDGTYKKYLLVRQEGKRRCCSAYVKFEAVDGIQ